MRTSGLTALHAERCYTRSGSQLNKPNLFEMQQELYELQKMTLLLAEHVRDTFDEILPALEEVREFIQLATEKITSLESKQEKITNE